MSLLDKDAFQSLDLTREQLLSFLPSVMSANPEPAASAAAGLGFSRGQHRLLPGVPASTIWTDTNASLCGGSEQILQITHCCFYTSCFHQEWV